MDDLTAWLRHQLDDDEQAARESANEMSGEWQAEHPPGSRWKVMDALGYSVVEYTDLDSEPWFATPHIARHDPARVLAEVDAKRRILAEHEHFPTAGGFGCRICAYNGRDGVIEPEGWCATVRLLALPYADRPGYRDEWRP